MGRLVHRVSNRTPGNGKILSMCHFLMAFFDEQEKGRAPSVGIMMVSKLQNNFVHAYMTKYLRLG